MAEAPLPFLTCGGLGVAVPTRQEGRLLWGHEDPRAQRDLAP